MPETALSTVFSRRRRLVFETRRRPLSLPRETSRPAAPNWLDKAKSLPDLRFDKVQALRYAIAKGDYDIDTRLVAVLGGLSDDLTTLVDPT